MFWCTFDLCFSFCERSKNVSHVCILCLWNISFSFGYLPNFLLIKLSQSQGRMLPLFTPPLTTLDIPTFSIFVNLIGQKGVVVPCFILICISFIISEFLCLSLCLLAVCTSEPLTVILLFNLSLIRRIKNKNNTFPKTKSCSVNIQQILTVYGYGRRFWFWLLALLQCASLMTSYPAL